ncbi:MAG: hypothetical protein ACRDOO_21650 [Actinomadura sp.]
MPSWVRCRRRSALPSAAVRAQLSFLGWWRRHQPSGKGSLRGSDPQRLGFRRHGWHIEAPTANKHYTLGQLFQEWQVDLSATALGGLKADAANTLSVYVNGKKQTGDPASIELLPRRQIALVYGPANAKVNIPSSYTFEQGE